MDALLEGLRESRKRSRSLLMEQIDRLEHLRNTDGVDTWKKKARKKKVAGSDKMVWIGDVRELLGEEERARREREKLVGKKTKKIRVDEVKVTEENIARRSLLNVMLGYRLSGVSMFNTQNEKEPLTGIRIDSSMNGKYYERYYILMKRKEDDYALYRHTLPYFIPIEELFAKKKSLRHFVKVISGYVNAFTSRREQVREAVLCFNEHEGSVKSVSKKQTAPNLEHSASSSFDTVTFSGRAIKQASVKFTFGNLFQSRPSGIHLKLPGDDSEQAISLTPDSTILEILQNLLATLK